MVSSQPPHCPAVLHHASDAKSRQAAHSRRGRSHTLTGRTQRSPCLRIFQFSNCTSSEGQQRNGGDQGPHAVGRAHVGPHTLRPPQATAVALSRCSRLRNDQGD